MALSKEEKQILEYAKNNGKSAIEAKAAIAKYRSQNPTQVTQPQTAQTFGQEAGVDRMEMGTNINAILKSGTEERQRIIERVSTGEVSPIKGTFQTLGKGLATGFKAIGEAGIGLAKMATSQKVEDKVSDVMKDAGTAFSEKAKREIERLRTGTETEKKVAAKIDETINLYKTDETFRTDVEAAGGILTAVGSLLGIKSNVSKGRKLAPELDTPYFREIEMAVADAIEATKKAKSELPTPLTEATTDKKVLTSQPTRGITDVAIDTAILGAQKTVQTYRDLVDASQTRIVRNLDNQALRENAKLDIKEVEQNIGKMYTNAVSPGVKGKKVTTGAITANIEQATASIKGLTMNKKDISFRDIETNQIVKGELPSNLWEFGGAVTSRKSKVYQDVLKQIGKAADEPVDTSRISDAMYEIIDNPVYANETAILNRARQSLEKYQLTDYTPSQLEELIKLENDRLQSFYRGSGTQADAIVSAIVANNLRDMLDEAVEAATGTGVKELKREYGNLASIERDVVHRALHNAQARDAGLVDMFGIRTIGDVSAGLAGDIGALRRGAGQIVGEGFIKALNDRDAMINRMFMVADQTYTKQ